MVYQRWTAGLSRAILVLAAATLVGAVSFDRGGLPPNPAPRAPDRATGNVGFTAPGLLQVYYGRDCADAVGQKNNGKTYFLPTSIRQEYVFPGYTDRAAVLLNGWELRYAGSDKDVGGVGVGIGEIALGGRKLRWVAEGSIHENGFNEAYSFCYDYVVVAWNGSQLDLASDQSTTYRTNQENGGEDSALTANGGFAPTPAAVGKETVALLPLGFYFSFDDDDQHLLQIAYDLGPHARYLRRADESFAYHMRACAPATGGFSCKDMAPPAVVATASRPDETNVSWISSGIFRDNRVRPYWFFDQMTVLTGDDVTLIEPPFAIVPVSRRSGERPERAGKEQTVDVEIRDLPFEYAVPMLTGWELRYYNNDEEVKRLGLHIHDVTYNAPGTAKGTLRYKLTGWLHDDDDRPGFRMRHKVHILGFDFGPD